MSMKNDDNKIKDVKSTVNLISGAYTLPLLNKLFSNSQRIEDRRLETEEEKIPFNRREPYIATLFLGSFNENIIS